MHDGRGITLPAGGGGSDLGPPLNLPLAIGARRERPVRPTVFRRIVTTRSTLRAHSLFTESRATLWFQ